MRGDRDPTLQFKFAIMVGGFTSTTPQHAELFRHKLAVPSVHAAGRADAIVSRRDSLLLADFLAGFSHDVGAAPAHRATQNR